MQDHMLHHQRLKNLRAMFDDYGIDGFVVPSTDLYHNEMPPECFKRLAWLTGFTGSAGIAVILKDEAALFTDGRYTLQAKKQLDGNDYEVINVSDQRPHDWTASKGNLILGYDPWLHNKRAVDSFDKMIPISPNPIDKCWTDKPEHPSSAIVRYEENYAGKSFKDKLKIIQATMQAHNAEHCVLTSSDSVCWLLNIRAQDLEHTPLLLSFALVSASGKVSVFADGKRQDEALPVGVVLEEIAHMESVLHGVRNDPVLLDVSIAPFWFCNVLKNIVDVPDPCLLPKAIKNATEIENMRQTHVIDGLAVTRFIEWLKQAVASGEEVTELKAVRRLRAYREEGEGFKGDSFDTIAGFGANGAIVHYRVTKESDTRVEPNGLFLVDSGGQYLTGTTDVTRTIAIGTPTEEQKKMYTLVLKGHIALAMAVFKRGTTGSDLDHLARQFLQAEGFDYDHGTGHGVGCYLHVHEGPMRISKLKNVIALQPGMILSNEPGYYKEGEYGIRIENLVVVVEKENSMLGFETLTKVPLDAALIDNALLSAEEKNWVHEYGFGF